MALTMQEFVDANNDALESIKKDRRDIGKHSEQILKDLKSKAGTVCFVGHDEYTSIVDSLPPMGRFCDGILENLGVQNILFERIIVINSDQPKRAKNTVMERIT